MTQTMANDATDFLPTRRTLLSRLKKADDQAGWQEFFDTYWKLIYGVAIKAGLTDAEAQDAVQETVIAVSKHIGRFKYDPAQCSFKTWLLYDAAAHRAAVREAGWTSEPPRPRLRRARRLAQRRLNALPIQPACISKPSGIKSGKSTC